ncbi:phosphoglycolate phosphatase [Inmirania thermothiophila]|uniref:Phosphoglycolate phosphatase n=1 Tax=Inmirania thermothiophila TaxID=1750597 RepID=A0A3N1XSB7_9GAMM|nr:phosphoglycolate phosphatase [Inmirania thermothiophila]ROR29536.1 phosphoglycolate phosphatase [Inmirania thermothiophila]
MSGACEAVLLDLDGTLVDSAPDLAAAVDEMLAALGRTPAGEAAVRRWIGNGAPRLVKRALTGEMEAEPDPALFERAYALFLDAYQRHLSEGTRLYPGVAQGLEGLAAMGLRLGCITNKPARFTEPLLARLGIRRYFGVVVSGDTLPRGKPDPAPLLHAAACLKIEPGRTLMVGDSVNDVQAARAAGMRVVCVPYGYNHGEDIAAAQPDAVIASLAELPAWILNEAA